MIKKIMQLSIFFVKDYFEKMIIFNENSNKINKKSILVWGLIIVAIAMSFLSFKIIGILNSVGLPELFLKGYFLILATIFTFQLIIISTSVLFFSKDLEHILPLPIKPIELLIAKYNSLILIIYVMEIIFLFLPLLIYGLIIAKELVYFLSMLIVLIMFPIFFTTIISTIMLVVMKLTKFIKNINLFQILVVIILSLIIIFTETYLIKTNFSNVFEINENNEISKFDIKLFNNKLDIINNYFIVVNPCVSLLTNLKISNIAWQFIKLITICVSTFIIFIYFGKILYLKNLLENISKVNKKKKNTKIINNKYEKNSIKKAYIKNEFKKLIKNPTFFLQCIFQYILEIIVFLEIINLFMPIILSSFEQQDIVSKMGENKFAIQALCIILGILQIIFTTSNLSITAISREGKNAAIMKYIPVTLYKQFMWKNVPQILINMIAIIGLAGVIYINVPIISIWYYIFGIIIASILNIINSYIMLIIDLNNPKLDWSTETAALKDNGNRIYQYATTIIIIILLSYISKVFAGIKFIISLCIITIILFIILFIINKIINKNINKIFKKII